MSEQVSALERTRQTMKTLGCAAPEPPPQSFKTTTPWIVTAHIDPSATIGEGSIIWWYARVLADVRIGDGVMIGGGTEIGRGSVIGDGTRIQANCFLPSHSEIGRNVFIGPGVVMTDDRYPYVRHAGEPPYKPEPPIIEDHASIGAGATIGPGVRIGRGARIAMGAVVTKDVAGVTCVVGIPARERAMPDEWMHRPAVA